MEVDHAGLIQTNESEKFSTASGVVEAVEEGLAEVSIACILFSDYLTIRIESKKRVSQS